MKVLEPKKLTEVVAGASRLPKFLRKKQFKMDGSGKLTVGSTVIAEFETPEEEAEFVQKLIDGPDKKQGRGWRAR